MTQDKVAPQPQTAPTGRHGRLDGASGKVSRTAGRLCGWFLSQRIRALALFAAGVYFLFAVSRAVILVAYRGELQNVPAWEIVRCFLVGAQFDSFTVGVAGIPLAVALAVAPNLAFPRRWFRRVITAYVTVLLAVLVFLLIAGAYFFFQFGFRMNWIAIDYLQFPREVFGYIWDQYPVVWVMLGIAALAAGLYWALGRILWSGPTPTAPIWPRPLLALFLVGLCVMGIRGSFDSKPLHVGRAYVVSDNSIVSQAALDDVYALMAAARTELANRSAKALQFRFPPDERMDQVVRDLLYQPEDTDLKAPRNPLWRRTATGRPMADSNVVVILAEGMSGRGVGALGHAPSYTPNFDALCRDGFFFDHMYAVGNRTNRAMVSVLCGYPDCRSRSVMIQSRAQGHFLTLPGLLRDRGYKTLFAYGGRNTWDNTKGFFVDGGQIEDFIGQDDIYDEAEVNPWGVSDEITFRKAHEQFLSYGDRKFFGAILTITNHEPFHAPPIPGQDPIPGDSLEVCKLNCYRYADWALGRFFEWARAAPYFKRTVFVIVADHGRDFAPDQYVDLPAYRVPCVIYAPGIVPPGRLSTVCSQTDVAPTVLGLLGGEFDHGFFGRNLLAAPSGEGFAFAYVNDMLGWVSGRRAAVLMPDRPPMLFRITDSDQDPASETEIAADMPPLREKMLSIYGVASRLYDEVRYCSPEKAAAVVRRPE